MNGRVIIKRSSSLPRFSLPVIVQQLTDQQIRALPTDIVRDALLRYVTIPLPPAKDHITADIVNVFTSIKLDGAGKESKGHHSSGTCRSLTGLPTSILSHIITYHGSIASSASC
jgi:hypothetical protein